MKTSTNKILSFLFSLLFSFVFAACCLKIPSLSEIISSKGNINLLTYAMTVILFCISYLLISLLLMRTKKTAVLDRPYPAITAALILFTVNLLFLIRMFQLETEVYGSVSVRYIWHIMPFWLVAVVLAAEAVFFFSFVKKSTISLKPSALMAFYGMLTLLIGYNFYTPEVFLRNEPDRLHMDAYFNSIYNVLHGSPYTEYTTSIYGHYGILYKLPMKLLGSDLADFILLNALIGALSFLAAFLALHFIIKNDLLRIIGAAAVSFPVLAMRSGIYWQLWPHRVLFMCLMLCYMAFCVRYKKLNRITCILGYGIVFLGILWNTESGLFCGAAWAGFWILKSLCSKENKPSYVIRTVFFQIFGIILSFLATWGTVELYNLANGGKIIGIQEFLFPLLQSSYMDDLLRVDLPDFASAYIVIIALLFLACAWGISHMWFLRKDQETTMDILPACFAFAAAVLTLGQITYFINRAAYHNLEIAHIPCIILLCLLAEGGMETFRRFRFKDLNQYNGMELFRCFFTGAVLLVLMTVCTGNVIQYGQNTALREELHNKQELNDFAAHIAANIPENTYAFGIGVPEIYSILRWDTGCYTLDLPDLSLRPEAGDHIMDDIKEKQIPAFLAGEGTISRMEKYSSKEKSQWLLDTYQVSQTFEFKGAVLQYYTLK